MVYMRTYNANAINHFPQPSIRHDDRKYIVLHLYAHVLPLCTQTPRKLACLETENEAGWDEIQITFRATISIARSIYHFDLPRADSCV